MIFRLLLLALAAWIVWRLLRTLAGPGLAQRPPAEQFEAMARCAKCGTYLPAKALSASGRCGACHE